MTALESSKKSVTIKDMTNPDTTGRYKTVETITAYNWEGKVAKVEVLAKYEGIVDKLSSTTYEYDGRGFMVNQLRTLRSINMMRLIKP